MIWKYIYDKLYSWLPKKSILMIIIAQKPQRNHNPGSLWMISLIACDVIALWLPHPQCNQGRRRRVRMLVCVGQRGVISSRGHPLSAVPLEPLSSWLHSDSNGQRSPLWVTAIVCGVIYHDFKFSQNTNSQIVVWLVRSGCRYSEKKWAFKKKKLGGRGWQRDQGREWTREGGRGREEWWFWVQSLEERGFEADKVIAAGLWRPENVNVVDLNCVLGHYCTSLPIRVMGLKWMMVDNTLWRDH